MSAFYAGKDTERSTIAASVGHWPVCFSFLVSKPEKLYQKVLNYSNADCNSISSALQVAIQIESSDLIKNFTSGLFQSPNDLIQDCSDMIPPKTIFIHSKPYWMQNQAIYQYKLKKPVESSELNEFRRTQPTC